MSTKAKKVSVKPGDISPSVYNEEHKKIIDLAKSIKLFFEHYVANNVNTNNNNNNMPKSTIIYRCMSYKEQINNNLEKEYLGYL